MVPRARCDSVWKGGDCLEYDENVRNRGSRLGGPKTNQFWDGLCYGLKVASRSHLLVSCGCCSGAGPALAYGEPGLVCWKHNFHTHILMIFGGEAFENQLRVGRLLRWHWWLYKKRHKLADLSCHMMPLPYYK